RRLVENTFHAVRADGDGGRHEGGEAADEGDDEERDRRVLIKNVRPDNEIDPGGDTRCGVDKRGNRCRALHRVRQPDMEWELGAFAGGAAKEEQRNPGDRGDRRRRDLGEDFRALPRPELVEYRDQPQAKGEIASTVDDEGFLGGARRGATG